MCVSQKPASHCYTSIQLAVNAAKNGAVINVAAGTYKESVLIGKPLSLSGAGADKTIIDATGLPNGILVDGLNNHGLQNVTIAGFTVQNALYEGILIINVSGATVRANTVFNNDLIGPVFGSGPACKGQPAYETDESGDCGGGIHLMGTTNVNVEGNTVLQNGDGVLLSDETAESTGNLIVHNKVVNNPLDCGIVLASHPPMGSVPPKYARHHGVDSNTVADNDASLNGQTTSGGSGVGIFSDGLGAGRATGNVIIGNTMFDNGYPGFALHSHAGPAVDAPADDMSGNMIIANKIGGNGADSGDTATAGPTGISINSGAGGSPIRNTTIAYNVIGNEESGIAINTPAEVQIHLNVVNDASISKALGVVDVCPLDNPSSPSLCTHSIQATENFWGCSAGPLTPGGDCVGLSGNVVVQPWLQHPPSQDVSIGSAAAVISPPSR